MHYEIIFAAVDTAVVNTMADVEAIVKAAQIHELPERLRLLN